MGAVTGEDIIMSRIGEIRLRVYDLLYANPVCCYAEETGNEKRSNVLILGNGWVGNEVFKGVFWAGQALDTRLAITVASQNAEDYGECICRTGEGALFPALRLFAEQKGYADLRFVNINISKEDNSFAEALDFKRNRYNYIVIALGSDEKNLMAVDQVLDCCLSDLAEDRRSVSICIYTDSNGVSVEDRCKALGKKAETKDIKILKFGTLQEELDKKIHGDMEDIARNINFGYEMKYDQRIGLEEADRRFKESYKTEFIDSPLDYEKGDLAVMSSFRGAGYAADSSLAAAVHVPVKLAVFGKKDTGPENPENPEERLSKYLLQKDSLNEAVCKKNGLYWELVALEHRRWNAYMVMRGFRAPTVEEEEAYLYKDGNTHQVKDMDRLLHICLCESGNRRPLKNDFDRQYDLWLKGKNQEGSLSELDRAGLRAHQLAGAMADKTDRNKVFRLLKGDEKELHNLRQSVQKLLNDEDHSLVLYQRSLETALGRFPESADRSERRVHIQEADRLLSAVKYRNARTDFFGLDEQQIEMLPFALWYREKYKTVITILGDYPNAAYDVIIPTLFCAGEAIFLMKNQNDSYVNAVRRYFQGRGAVTQPILIKLKSLDMNSVYEAIELQFNYRRNQELIINCVPVPDYGPMLAIGKMMGKYPGGIHAVQYVRHQGIISFSQKRYIEAGLDNKSFSLSEFIDLMGCKVSNEYTALYENSSIRSLKNIFEEYNETVSLEESDKKIDINKWACISEFFAGLPQHKDYPVDVENESRKTLYKGTFASDVFENAGIGTFLDQLAKFDIIEGWNGPQVTEVEGQVKVCFFYVNAEIVSMLRQFESTGSAGTGRSCQIVSFLPLEGILRISDLCVKRVPIISKKHHTEKHKQIRIDFLKKFCEKGFIKNLKINKKDTASFMFSNESVMKLMKTRDAVFELVVYEMMRESGRFDDVEAGVKICWDANQISAEEHLVQACRDNITGYGYGKYQHELKQIKNAGFGQGGNYVKNESYIIGLRGMNAVMVSCKTSSWKDPNWIYEFKALADHFQAEAVLAVPTNQEKSRTDFVRKARQMKVSLWGKEILTNLDKFRNEIDTMIDK